MPSAQNPHVEARLKGLQQMLVGAHAAGESLSSSSKGVERSAFVNDFLRQVLPPTFRFGEGDVTDQAGNQSGQLDVVVEFPFLPSLPVRSGPRLYLAEGIAAVVEVKSDVASQWGQAIETARGLAKITRGKFAGFHSDILPLRIPLFVVGFTGWKTVETVAKRLGDGPVDGILVIDEGIFVSTPQCGNISATGPWSLWGLISRLSVAAKQVSMVSMNPAIYGVEEQPLKLGCDQCIECKDELLNYCTSCGFHLTEGFVQWDFVGYHKPKPTDRFCGICGGAKEECPCKC